MTFGTSYSVTSHTYIIIPFLNRQMMARTLYTTITTTLGLGPMLTVKQRKSLTNQPLIHMRYTVGQHSQQHGQCAITYSSTSVVHDHLVLQCVLGQKPNQNPYMSHEVQTAIINIILYSSTAIAIISYQSVI